MLKKTKDPSTSTIKNKINRRGSMFVELENKTVGHFLIKALNPSSAKHFYT